MSAFQPLPDEPGRFTFPEIHCVWCGFMLNAVAERRIPEPIVPRDGDGMVCFGCAMPNMVVIDALDRVGLRKPTEEELALFVEQHRDLILRIHIHHLRQGPRRK